MASPASFGSPMDWEATRTASPITPRGTKRNRDAVNEDDDDFVRRDTRFIPHIEIEHLSELVDSHFKQYNPYPEGYVVGGWPAPVQYNQMNTRNNIALMSGALPASPNQSHYGRVIPASPDGTRVPQRYQPAVLHIQQSEPSIVVRALAQVGNAKRACLELASYAYNARDAAIAVNHAAFDAVTALSQITASATVTVTQSVVQLVRQIRAAKAGRRRLRGNPHTPRRLPRQIEMDEKQIRMSNRKFLKHLDEQTKRQATPVDAQSTHTVTPLRIPARDAISKSVTLRRTHSEYAAPPPTTPLRFPVEHTAASHNIVEQSPAAGAENSSFTTLTSEERIQATRGPDRYLSTGPFERAERLFPKQRTPSSPVTPPAPVAQRDLSPKRLSFSPSHMPMLLPEGQLIPQLGNEARPTDVKKEVVLANQVVDSAQPEIETGEQAIESTDQDRSMLWRSLRNAHAGRDAETDTMSDISSTIDPEWWTPTKVKIPTPPVTPEPLPAAQLSSLKPPVSGELASKRMTRSMALRAAREKEAAARKLKEEAARLEEERRRCKIEPLSKEWELKVEDALKRGHGEYNKVAMSRVVPPDGASGTSGWLNDETINGYLKLICDRGNQGQKPGSTPKHAAFNSFFMKNLIDKGYSGVARWSKRLNIDGRKLLDVESVYIPVNSGAHWTLLVVSPTSKTIRYYDSLGGAGNKFIEQAKVWLKGQLGNDFNAASWATTTAASPRQANMSDCGVFTVTTAKVLMQGGSPMSYGPAQIPTQRRRMVAELVAGRLL